MGSWGSGYAVLRKVASTTVTAATKSSRDATSTSVRASVVTVRPSISSTSSGIPTVWRWNTRVDLPPADGGASTSADFGQAPTSGSRQRDATDRWEKTVSARATSDADLTRAR